ncbi:unnamed protein product [Mytilus edulis]|uniref:Uncharacterized protein n=1 Tax=Mytilus edulis TaxID=6550 RepID=A0A8S3TAZ3_MYTED|nr:unnamed protein product [Mytilus edulis]
MGCVMLPNGNLLMANNTKEHQLIEYSYTGEHVRDIRVSDKPYRIAVIDLNRIVVTYGDACFMEIINNNTFKVEKKINLRKSCLGVSHKEGDFTWYIAKFESDCFNFLYDLTVDTSQNVYVIGTSTNSLTLIQNDGRDSITLMTESDELLAPQAVCFDEDTNTLLIGNRKYSIVQSSLMLKTTHL